MNTGGESNVLERRPIFWFYGSSSIAYGIKDNAFSYLLLTFANQALGVPGYLASLALAIAIVWDEPLLSFGHDFKDFFNQLHLPSDPAPPSPCPSNIALTVSDSTLAAS